MDIKNLLENPKELEKTFKKAIKEKDEEIANLLSPYIKDPELVYLYAKRIVKDKVSDELEEVIAQDPQYSYKYAKYILKGPFPKGEDAIAQDPEWSFKYAF
ncbi:MAG: hypothetical protein QW103_02610, partial [Candidatus Pacearchaeota archaeon]